MEQNQERLSLKSTTALNPQRKIIKAEGPLRKRLKFSFKSLHSSVSDKGSHMQKL